jgi:hypothetical protein
MRNPLIDNFKGYPVWGWIVLLFIVALTAWGLISGFPAACNGRGDCV